MEFYVEWRQRGDSYNNGYGNGHTLSQSESVQKMKEIKKTDDFTKYQLDDILLTAYHKKTGDGVTECRTNSPWGRPNVSSCPIRSLSYRAISSPLRS